MSLQSVFDLYKPAYRKFAIALLLLLLIFCWTLTYVTGGTSQAYPHAMYIPVILAGSLFGLWGGLGAGLAATLLLGPFMPMDVENGLPQPVHNWMFRGVFLTLVGLIAGMVTSVWSGERKRLVWLSGHSADTGLPNLHSLRSALGRQHRCGVLVLVKITNFEHILNALGPGLGDQVRLALARQLSSIDSCACPIFEVDRDKLALILPDTEALSACLATLSSTKTLHVRQVPVFTEFAVGSVPLNDTDDDHSEIRRRAHVALFEASVRGCLHVSSTQVPCNDRRRSLELLTALPDAIASGELTLVYQPKVCLLTGHTMGIEALVRWDRPGEGMVPPDEFVPISEDTALIHQITRFVLREALVRTAELHRQGKQVSVAVNISARDLADPELAGFVLGTLHDSGISPHFLELEITESAIVEISETSLDCLRLLRAQGVRIAIDDFGAGYTSLRHLTALPVSCVKIDRDFVRNLLIDTRTHRIVLALIELARDMGLTVVAEGIEDNETRDALRALGCHQGQGYLFSKPLDMNDASTGLSNLSSAVE